MAIDQEVIGGREIAHWQETCRVIATKKAQADEAGLKAEGSEFSRQLANAEQHVSYWRAYQKRNATRITN